MRSGGAGDRAWRCAGRDECGQYDTGGSFFLHQHGSYGHSRRESGGDRAGEGGHYKKQVLCCVGKTGPGSDESSASVRPYQKREVSDGGSVARKADQVRRGEAAL